MHLLIFLQFINQSINQSWIYIVHTRKASNDTKRQKFESHSLFGIEEYIV